MGSDQLRPGQLRKPSLVQGTQINYRRTNHDIHQSNAHTIWNDIHHRSVSHDRLRFAHSRAGATFSHAVVTAQESALYNRVMRTTFSKLSGSRPSVTKTCP